MLAIKRVYAPYEKSDGFRVLVDRLWPRGVSKERAKVDVWLKDIAPSSELRKWFGHDEKRFSEFRRRYLRELAANEALVELRRLAKTHKKLTLLYAAKDQEHNEAAILHDVLRRKA
ncbi:MAG TPA: DUF488 domain-containing protein [Candidatus Paceibacterota bacterium]